jgi:hypothetical protein
MRAKQPKHSHSNRTCSGSLKQVVKFVFIYVYLAPSFGGNHGEKSIIAMVVVLCLGLIVLGAGVTNLKMLVIRLRGHSHSSRFSRMGF